jgi:hypothetical protein
MIVEEIVTAATTILDDHGRVGHNHPPAHPRKV